ncbi:hypothetical protein ELQ35_22175 [Peribacillus cavernae]|uniref:Uncharacterized protein n=1 Tax=Peribacillus cavernae TaxID=1674310 RepID=A0A433H753_9BACI|nr:hypothetical protein [Peribacillus cavernae]MDQ0221457.1 hypothetical protein [Peribacillus cavernae]RUQ24167.1 hypothetical protein ELQ35_22175 [Peribacillus cavernae]
MINRNIELELEIFEYYEYKGQNYYVEVFTDGNAFEAFASLRQSSIEIDELIGMGIDPHNKDKAIENAIFDLKLQLM